MLAIAVKGSRQELRFYKGVFQTHIPVKLTVLSENEYITDSGQTLTNVHEYNQTCDLGCVIHNPTDPHLDWPTYWRDDRRIMERICPHGVGHPDRDSINFIKRTRGKEIADAEAVHGCDGCCR